MPPETSGPVVSNAGPLIVLAKLNLLHLLKALYERLHIPRSVYEEAVTAGLRAGHEDAQTLQLFLLQTEWPIHEIAPHNVPTVLEVAPLDRGERDALALAMMLRSRLVLMDETAGRKVAREHQITVRGSLGVLIQSYRKDVIDADQLRLYLAELARRKDIWLNPTLVQRLRREVLGES